MSSDAVKSHMLQKIGDATVETDPFPHVVVDNVFDPDYYQQILENFPETDTYQSLASTGRSGYKDRHVVLFEEEHLKRLDEKRRAFWNDFWSILTSQDFVNGIVGKLREPIMRRLAEDGYLEKNKGKGIQMKCDGLLISDRTNYAIGPHTDAPHRVITLLFYAPEDDSNRQYGTSTYRPKDPNFKCKGGPHHKRELFDRVSTADFIPNRLFMFPKTSDSFHGVEPITEEGIDRRLIIYNVRMTPESMKGAA
ncbi:MAG: hypothetical protein NXI16_14475 [Alphaproteobacteria bacterium]|nr:hypothetical protein [Alphaproteobacteria bacterium]